MERVFRCWRFEFSRSFLVSFDVFLCPSPPPWVLPTFCARLNRCFSNLHLTHHIDDNETTFFLLYYIHTHFLFEEHLYNSYLLSILSCMHAIHLSISIYLHLPYIIWNL